MIKRLRSRFIDEPLLHYFVLAMAMGMLSGGMAADGDYELAAFHNVLWNTLLAGAMGIFMVAALHPVPRNFARVLGLVFSIYPLTAWFIARPQSAPGLAILMCSAAAAYVLARESLRPDRARSLRQTEPSRPSAVQFAIAGAAYLLFAALLLAIGYYGSCGYRYAFATGLWAGLLFTEYRFARKASPSALLPHVHLANAAAAVLLSGAGLWDLAGSA
ncbi:MAG: hypothetical protein KJ052_12590 [Candidatus Hydrogenedentes bacterium]|nr:hypothetical protein [Candidatus Hydrogenedentota bacterium]